MNMCLYIYIGALAAWTLFLLLALIHTKYCFFYCDIARSLGTVCKRIVDVHGVSGQVIYSNCLERVLCVEFLCMFSYLISVFILYFMFLFKSIVLAYARNVLNDLRSETGSKKDEDQGPMGRKSRSISPRESQKSRLTAVHSLKPPAGL
ncbi:hypothetical protein BDW74DRAFT_133406 [Aspergillus multicolor]|uniref:uncharacterized protein n=1 Tax=Aspergillus multicolor TaxID=41759 RepID=UPI003CCD2E42